jgi:hypothetical protein
MYYRKPVSSRFWYRKSPQVMRGRVSAAHGFAKEALAFPCAATKHFALGGPQTTTMGVRPRKLRERVLRARRGWFPLLWGAKTAAYRLLSESN